MSKSILPTHQPSTATSTKKATRKTPPSPRRRSTFWASPWVGMVTLTILFVMMCYCLDPMSTQSSEFAVINSSPAADKLFTVSKDGLTIPNDVVHDDAFMTEYSAATTTTADDEKSFLGEVISSLYKVISGEEDHDSEDYEDDLVDPVTA